MKSKIEKKRNYMIKGKMEIIRLNVRIVSFQDGLSYRHRRIHDRDSNEKFAAPCDHFVSYSMNERGVGLLNLCDDDDRGSGDRSKCVRVNTRQMNRGQSEEKKYV